MGRRHVTPQTVQYWARPQHRRPSLLDAPPPLHRKPFRQQLRRDAAQLFGPVLTPIRRWTEQWGGAAVDAMCRISSTTAAAVAGLAMLTVVIAMTILVTGAGQ